MLPDYDLEATDMKRKHMYHIQDIIRRLQQGESERRSARDMQIVRGTVHKYSKIAKETSYGGDLPGVWITGDDMVIGQIFDGPASAPIWNFDDNTLFFLSGSELGTDLYRATFSNYYNDAAPVARLTGNIFDVVWVGIK